MATTTVNISLPMRLKKDADKLVEKGYYASFSDFARTTMRYALMDLKYEAIIEESKREEALGTATVLKNTKDIEEFVNKIGR